MNVRNGTAMVATALTLSLSLTGSQPLEGISPEHEALLEQTFDDAQRYWTAQGLGMGVIELVLLENGDTRRCVNETEDPDVTVWRDISSYETSAMYCSGSDEIIIPQGFVAAWVSEMRSPASFLIFTMAHEDAHGTQDLTGAIDHFRGTVTLLEIDADCLAGRFMQQYAPEHLESVMRDFEPRGFMMNHSTGAEVAYYLEMGASGGQCPVESLLEDQ